VPGILRLAKEGSFVANVTKRLNCHWSIQSGILLLREGTIREGNGGKLIQTGVA
jgi:hypothetical protein